MDKELQLEDFNLICMMKVMEKMMVLEYILQ